MTEIVSWAQASKTHLFSKVRINKKRKVNPGFFQIDNFSSNADLLVANVYCTAASLSMLFHLFATRYYWMFKLVNCANNVCCSV